MTIPHIPARYDHVGSFLRPQILQEAREKKASGQITRSAVAEVPVKGRDTMGVKFVGVKGDDTVTAITLYPESNGEAAAEATDEETPVEASSAADSVEPGNVASDESPDADAVVIEEATPDE